MTSLEILYAIREKGDDQSWSGPGPDSVFPSRRAHPFFPINRTDNTIFFPLLICFILRQYDHLFSPDEKVISSDILERIRKICPAFRNFQKGYIYNFWPVGDKLHFPGSNMLHRFQHFKLPEDLDTTALVHLAFPDILDKEQQYQLKDQVSHHTNQVKGRVINALPAHAELKAYSSWIGERMPVEFDICALSNFMLWIEQNELPINEYDHDSLQLLSDVIMNDLYFSRPHSISPYYPNPAVQLYHLARLFSIKKDAVATRDKLIKDLQITLSKSQGVMERMILESSLLKLGAVPADSITMNLEEVINVRFSWFRAAFLAPYKNYIARALLKVPLFEMRYYCEAFNLSLTLEHFLLTKRSNKNYDT